MVGEDQGSEVREAAGCALDELGEHAALAVPALTNDLSHEDSKVRRDGR